MLFFLVIFLYLQSFFFTFRVAFSLNYVISEAKCMKISNMGAKTCASACGNHYMHFESSEGGSNFNSLKTLY